MFNTGTTIHAQLLQLGETVWDGYFELRNDPVAPTCDSAFDVETEVQKRLAQASAEEDLAFDLFAAEAPDEGMLRQSLVALKEQCLVKQQHYAEIKDQVTPGLKVFRSVEKGVAEFGQFGIASARIFLAILVLICGGMALFRRHHIALKPMETVMDYRVAAVAQMIAFSILFYSVYSFKEIVFSSGVVVPLEHAVLHWIWIFGFAAPIFISIYQFFVIPKDALPGGSYLKAQLAVPLYASMAMGTGLYFLLADHPAGIAIYLNQMMEMSQLFLSVGLYVWIGMLLKRTEMVQKVFNVFRPFNLAPEVFAIAVVALAALPTAYTGGSGIFIIAVGSLVYMELRRGGARRQLALAASAMSGSLGVVLRPCLLVVIVAALNNEVTTDQLFGWGGKVFLLTISLFTFYALLTRKTKGALAKLESDSWSQFLNALKPLLPYVILISVILVLYSLLLNAHLDEFSAPIILPVLLLAILVYERIAQEKGFLKRENMNANYAEERLHTSLSDLKSGNDSMESTIRESTKEASVHIGALLMLMGMSMSLGGVVERSEIMTMVPLEFGSIWLAMASLVAILVIIGMIMDPYGAVVLVSVSIASIAYQAGIDPVHFWMVTLVAFELGYLSPPVALNHLLTRQVVGEEEVRLSKLDVIGESFWYRHEKILLPLVTMATALLIVAFVPLAVGY
ncbi:MAG: TRAP transporter large permease subunit [Oleibacter sp.]|nr:TRAP transporter large permease subunit [Thalassolituus sp.]